MAAIVISSRIPGEGGQPLDGAFAVRLADLRCVEGLAEEMDGAVVVLPVHRVGVVVLPAVGVAETGRVAKRGLRAVEGKRKPRSATDNENPFTFSETSK